MKFKKLIIGVLTFAIAASCIVGVFAEEKSSEVEISFKVGDEVLLINGSPVTVEKPFVAGEGTTLVPLRVITEAFGATVDWEDATRKITLTYPDVSIVLQIGNQVAQVNDHAETLLEVPVLMNSTTMVPLRFISETFGAVVTYDEATEGITVKKETGDDNETVQGMTELAKIGDSYYGWTMDTPKDFLMSDRGFDGSYTYFEDAAGNQIDIDIYESDEDTTFDEYFGMVKESYSGTTLVKADKLTDKTNKQYMHFQAKSEGEFYDLRVWRYNGYDIGVYITLMPEITEEQKNACLALADSFTVSGVFNDTVYDLSDVENGFRQFESEDYKVSFKVPADYYQQTYGVGENEMVFIKSAEDGAPVTQSIHMSIFSKSETVTAEKLAKSDREIHYGYANKELVTVTEPVQTEINSMECWEYSKSAEKSKYDSPVMRDIFFELGDYVYNFSIVTSKEVKADTVNTIVESLKAEELDFAEIGTMLRNDPEDVDKKIKTDKWSLSIGSNWQQSIEATQTGVVFSNISAQSSLGISFAYSNDAPAAGPFFRDYIANYKKTNKFTDVLPIKTVTIGKNTYYKTILKHDAEERVIYETIFFRAAGGTAIIVSLVEDELYYGGNTTAEVEEMLKSIELL